MKTVTEITAEKKEASEIRLAAYCRVSSGSADQRHSFAAQIQYYSDYCKQNPQCRIWIGITDEALLGGITDLLNDVIVHPERLQATAGAFTPSDAVQKLEAEIRQTLERGTFDKAVFHQNMTVNRVFCHHFCLFSDFFGRQNGRPAVAGRPFCLTDITHT